MSKLETVKDLNTTGPQVKIVESVRELQQTVNALAEDLNRLELEKLPGAVSSEIVAALEPLEGLKESVTKALLAYDRVTEVQRASLEQMSVELLNRASREFQQKAKVFEHSMLSGTEAAEMLQRSTKSLIQTEASLRSAAESQQTAATRIEQLSKLGIVWIFGIALIGGVVGAIGHTALSWLLHKSETQQWADYGREIYRSATEKERSYLESIRGRQGK